MGISNAITDRAYSTYETIIEKEVMSHDIPQHIAVIMDGNRRYAEEVLKADKMEGHKLGKDKLEDVLHWCLKLDVRILTVYAFSTENFNRAESEVEYLMELLESSLYEFADDPEVHEHRVAINVIGDLDMLPDPVIKAMNYAKEKTEGYDSHFLNMAIAYSGRQDIVQAVRNIVQDAKDGKIDVIDVNESLITGYISTYGFPDPDLVMRTSGEIRISNFLLWQMAYSELYFTDVYWPGFRYIDLLRAVRTYQQRKRRYGR